MGFIEEPCDACGGFFDPADVDVTGAQMIRKYDQFDQVLCVRCAKEAHEIAEEVMHEDMEVDLGGEG